MMPELYQVVQVSITVGKAMMQELYTGVLFYGTLKQTSYVIIAHSDLVCHYPTISLSDNKEIILLFLRK